MPRTGALVCPTTKAPKDGGFFLGGGIVGRMAYGSKSDAKDDHNLSHLQVSVMPTPTLDLRFVGMAENEL